MIQSEWGKRFFLDANIRFDDNDSFGGHTTGRVAAAYIVPYIETKLKASYGTGFKAPTLTDLYVSISSLNYYANPSFKPEKAMVRRRFRRLLFNDRIRFGSTYFHNSFTNLIDCVQTNTCINIGRALTYGAESFASFAVNPELNLRLDYTYLMALNEITNTELVRRPKNKVSFTPSWKATDDLTLSATLVYVSPWAETRIAQNTVPLFDKSGYMTVNLAANYVVTDNITLFGRVDNLFDLKYEDPAGYLRPGLGIFGGVKVKTYVADLLEPVSLK